MGTKAMDKISDMCKKYLLDRQGKQVGVAWIRRIIRLEIGADQRTIDQYMHLMAEFKIIRLSKNPGMVEILKRPE